MTFGGKFWYVDKDLLFSFIECGDDVDDYQFGFRKRHSTALLLVLVYLKILLTTIVSMVVMYSVVLLTLQKPLITWTTGCYLANSWILVNPLLAILQWDCLGFGTANNSKCAFGGRILNQIILVLQMVSDKVAFCSLTSFVCISETRLVSRRLREVGYVRLRWLASTN